MWFCNNLKIFFWTFSRIQSKSGLEFGTFWIFPGSTVLINFSQSGPFLTIFYTNPLDPFYLPSLTTLYERTKTILSSRFFLRRLRSLTRRAHRISTFCVRFKNVLKTCEYNAAKTIWNSIWGFSISYNFFLFSIFSNTIYVF